MMATMTEGADMFRTHLIITALLLGGTLASPVSAEEASDPEFDAIVAQAVEHYGAQRYEQAIELFERAYAMQPQPELIYNIGRIYERSVQREQAVEQYERFLGLPNTTADLRARAATSLEALRTELAVLQRANQPNSDDNNSGSNGSGEPNTAIPIAPPIEEGPSNTGAVIGWLLIGTGAAALITGGLIGGIALGAEGDAEEAQSLDAFDTNAARANDLALGSDVLFAAGGAMAIAGIVILIVRASRGEEDVEEETELDQAITPIFLGRNGLGLSFNGRF